MTNNYLVDRRNILKDGEDKSFVELIDLMPHPSSHIEPDLAVASAARVSYLGESKGIKADEKLVRYLLKNRHTTPFEQVEFKFRVRAPALVWWQWVRHRTWHYNFQSGRYTAFQEDDFYVPDKWRTQAKENKQMSDGVASDGDQIGLARRFKYIVELGFESYDIALKGGIAREQARLFLPAWASYYTAICKVDAWNLMHFLRLRVSNHAQWEIRQYAFALRDIFEQYMPVTHEAWWDYMIEEKKE